MSNNISFQSYFLYYLGTLLQCLERYTLRITPIFENSEISKKISAFLYSSHSLKDLKPKPTISRLLFLSIIIAVISSVIGQIAFSKIGWGFQEGKPMTIFSFLMLISTAYILNQIWLADSKKTKIDYDNQRTVWWFLSWGFYIAAWDEVLRLHETLDNQLHNLVGVKPNHLTDHLDDLFVGVYGVIGVSILFYYRKEIIRFISVWPYFAIAALLGSASVIIDLLGSDKPFLSLFVQDPAKLRLLVDILDLFEESFKIFSEIFFLGLVLAIYRINTEKATIIPNDSPNHDCCK